MKLLGTSIHIFKWDFMHTTPLCFGKSGFLKGVSLSYPLVALTKATCGRKGYSGSQFEGTQAIMVGRRGGRSTRHLLTRTASTVGEAERWTRVLSLLCIQFKTSAHRMVPPTGRVDLPSRLI